MPQQKRGLGKGLGALIPSVSSTAAADPGHAGPWEGQPDGVGAYFDEIPVGAITPNPRQPRQVFDEETLEELAASIGAVGLLQPVVVRKDRKSTRLNSSHANISYAVFCFKKKKKATICG